MKYEVLLQKGQKVIMPIRYSVRHANIDTSFHTGEAFSALPTIHNDQMDDLFPMNPIA